MGVGSRSHQNVLTLQLLGSLFAQSWTAFAATELNVLSQHLQADLAIDLLVAHARIVRGVHMNVHDVTS